MRCRLPVADLSHMSHTAGGTRGVRQLAARSVTKTIVQTANTTLLIDQQGTVGQSRIGRQLVSQWVRSLLWFHRRAIPPR